MNQVFAAYLYRHDVDASFRAQCKEKLKVSFLRSPIVKRSYTNRLSLSAQGTTLYRFFADTEWEQGIRVQWLSESEKSVVFEKASSDQFPKRISTGKRKDAMRFVWAKQPVTEDLRELSQFMRGSNSLRAKDFVERSAATWLAADALGLIVLSTDTGKDIRPARAAMVMALLTAYESAIDHAVDRLAEGGGSGLNDMERLLGSVATFYAQSYFNHPVVGSTLELQTLYDAMRDRRRLAERNDELRRHLELTAALARLARQRDEDDRDKRLTRRQGRLEIAIGFLGAIVAGIGLVQINPETVKSFNGWFTASKPESTSGAAPQESVIDSKPSTGSASTAPKAGSSSGTPAKAQERRRSAPAGSGSTAAP